jgi:hypothetical protein
MSAYPIRAGEEIDFLSDGLVRGEEKEEEETETETERVGERTKEREKKTYRYVLASLAVAFVFGKGFDDCYVLCFALVFCKE